MFTKVYKAMGGCVAALALLVGSASWSTNAHASEPFLAQIVMFGSNFAPRGWALCDGQILPISSNQALFVFLGTTYGGDGRTTFALPDMRGRVPIHAGSGPGLSTIPLGQKGGVEDVALSTLQIPSHTHTAVATADLNGTSSRGTSLSPGGKTLGSERRTRLYSTAAPDAPMSAGSVLVGVTNSNAGGGGSHTNVQPYQAVNFIIALVGTFPSRN
jgi:microcystin-dependent protein